jgi:hypothetical protein
MNLSYQEKIIWGSLATMLVVYGYYFATVLGVTNEDFDGASAARLVFAVFGIVVIEAFYHIVFSLKSRVEPQDEQDVLIEGKAYRTTYFLLLASLFLSMAAMVLSNLFSASTAAKFIMRPFIAINLMLLCVVVSEVLKFLMQLFFHRRGIRNERITGSE